MMVLAFGGGVSLFIGLGFGGEDCTLGDGVGEGRFGGCFPGVEVCFDDEAVVVVVVE
jgi:hypothetical protein